MADTQPVEKTVEQTGTLKFGMEGLKNPTPAWATWIFRTEFVLNKVGLAFLASMPGITLAQIKMGVWLFLVADGVTWGLGRFVGVKKEDIEKQFNQ